MCACFFFLEGFFRNLNEGAFFTRAADWLRAEAPCPGVGGGGGVIVQNRQKKKLPFFLLVCFSYSYLPVGSQTFFLWFITYLVTFCVGNVIMFCFCCFRRWC